MPLGTPMTCRSSPLPAALTARTANRYFVPLVRPVTVWDLVAGQVSSFLLVVQMSVHCSDGARRYCHLVIVESRASYHSSSIDWWSGYATRLTGPAGASSRLARTDDAAPSPVALTARTLKA